MTHDPVSIFKRFDILKDLPERALEELAQGCKWRSVAAGKPVFLHGDPPGDVYFIVEGKVKIVLYAASNGSPVLFTISGPNAMFGEVAAIDDQPRSATVEAEEQCKLAILSRQQFKQLAERHPAFAFAIMRQLAAHIRRLSLRVFEFSTMVVQCRIYSELLRCAHLEDGQTTSVLLSPAPNRTELAARVSTSREAVSRAITILKKKGIVRKEGKDLRILNPESLRKLVFGERENNS